MRFIHTRPIEKSESCASQEIVIVTLKLSTRFDYDFKKIRVGREIKLDFGNKSLYTLKVR